MLQSLCFAWEGSMKLGLIRTPSPRATDVSRTALYDELALAGSLGFDLAYLPKADPRWLMPYASSPKLEHLRICLDASAFGRISPSDLEAAVRSTADALDGKLYIGIEMCSQKSSVRSRSEAQNFETLFAQDESNPIDYVASRFPMRPPCPEVVGIPVTGCAQEAALAAARGYRSLTPSWLPLREVARHWPAIVAGATSTLRRTRPSFWHLARTIVIHDDPAVLNRYVYGPQSPIRAYYSRLAASGLIDQDIDEVLKQVVIAGSVAQVAENILALREAVGNIGTLHFVSHAGCDTAMTRP